MKKILFATAIILLFVQNTRAQIDVNNLINSSKEIINGSGTKVSEKEVADGLKEALTVGSKNSASKAAKVDGYYKNSKVKIPFPPEVKEVEGTLNSLGMTKQTEEFVKSLNRAAEEAAKEAAPIFVDAIKQMTITDGVNILKGSDDAATKYLKNKTSEELKAKFKPIVKKAIGKAQVTKYWNPLAKKYNKLPMVKKVNPNLEDYVTAKAIEGLFKLVAEEELKIRKDPMARVTDLLKKVFG